MTEEAPRPHTPSACQDCTNLAGFLIIQQRIWPKCRAFPKGIPESVMTGQADHRTPINGDHGIQYTPRPGPSANAEEMAVFQEAVEADAISAFALHMLRRRKSSDTAETLTPPTSKEDAAPN